MYAVNKVSACIRAEYLRKGTLVIINNKCDPTWVNEAYVGRGQFCDIFIFVFYMNYGFFKYQDHDYSTFHSKVMMISNSQQSLTPNSIYWVTASWRIDFINKSMT